MQIQNDVEKSLIFPIQKELFETTVICYCTTVKFHVDPKELEEFHIPLQNYHLRY